MRTKNIIFIILVSFFIHSCKWPSRTIYKTHFDSVKYDRDSISSDILLARNDSLEVYATVRLSDWEVENSVSKGSAAFDSIKSNAKNNSEFICELSTTNKGLVKIKDFEVRIFQLQNSKIVDSVSFNQYCKRKEWEVECFNSKQELAANLDTIGYDQHVSSQLIFRLITKSPKLFNEKKLFAQIHLDLVYNGWPVNLNFSDTLSRKEIIKSYLLHP